MGSSSGEVRIFIRLDQISNNKVQTTSELLIGVLIGQYAYELATNLHEKMDMYVFETLFLGSTCELDKLLKRRIKKTSFKMSNSPCGLEITIELGRLFSYVICSLV